MSGTPFAGKLFEKSGRVLQNLIGTPLTSLARIARLLAASAALALTGCGSKQPATDTNAAAEVSATSSESAAPLNPCSLLTADEVGGITTDKVRAAEREDNTCTYKSGPGDDDGLQVQVFKGEGEKQMRAFRGAGGLLSGMGAAVKDKGGAGANAAAMMKTDSTAAPTLGDEAAWGMNTMLAVRKGADYIQVTPPLMHDPANHPGYPLIGGTEKRAIVLTAAKKALARL